MRIKYIDYGTGNRVGKTIYLNRKLKQYPRLHDAILNHEKKHTEGYGFADFGLDLRNEDLEGMKWNYYKFVFTTPGAWIQLSPIMKLDGRWCIDFSLLIFWKLILITFLAIMIVVG